MEVGYSVLQRLYFVQDHWGNGWLFLLGLIPIVGWIADIVQMHKLSKSFGHGIGYTLGLLFLPSIFMLILGFSDDRYVGPAV